MAIRTRLMMRLLFLMSIGLAPRFCGAQIIDTAIQPVNVTLNATATTNGSLWSANWSADLLIDGLANVVHGDGAGGVTGMPEEDGFGYFIDLGDTFDLEGIDLLPRQDACCPDRLRDFRVGIREDNGGFMGGENWGIDLFPDEDAPGGPGSRISLVAADAPGDFSGRFVSITTNQDPVDEYELQLSEVEVFTGGVEEVPINYALHADAFTNGTLWLGGIAGGPANLTDGNLGTIIHGDGAGGTTGVAEEFGMYYEIDLGQEIEIAELKIWPRQDGCCPERLTFYGVSIHEDNNGSAGNTVWSTVMRDDFSTPEAGPTDPELLTADLDPSGEFTGQWIRIISLEDPIDYRLQLAEVEVFGHLNTGGLLGDFDSSGVLDIADIDLLSAEILAQTNGTGFDLNDDGQVDQEDSRIWVEDLKMTLMGDSNLDFIVDAQDLNTLGIRWQQTGQLLWSGGDFNSDGAVNSTDLNVLGLNWQQSAMPALAVPEPSQALVLCSVLIYCGIRRRRGR